MNTTADKIGTLWCNLMHDSPMWPIHDRYECRSCGRQYPVAWENANRDAPLRGGRWRLGAVRPALPVLAIAALALLAGNARAADSDMVNASSAAASAFARYIAGQDHADPWRVETLEIQASLPKLAKEGRLRAVRRLREVGSPEYEGMEISGDQTVKRQVIARYLSEDARVATLPAAAVAVTPANYRFKYLGTLRTAAGVAYAFAINPRHKREGLIEGEIWLDGQTGIAVHEAGRLVKRPSIFVKRFSLVRETTLRDGSAEMRKTRISIDTRIAGPAELTVVEHRRVEAAAVETAEQE